ncbi:MAG: RecT family recombinase [Pseudomonadota bacterium]
MGTEVVDLKTASPSQAIVFSNMQDMMKGAELMANAKHMVPDHFIGNPGGCMAIIMQAQRWGMDPFVVASKTHIVSGKLGYEAQLVNAVVQNSGMIVGGFHYEYRGEGAELACRVGAVRKGEQDITWGEWLAQNSVKVQNSPLWKTNPKQQLSYLQVKNWARLYTPGAILGVYTSDELRDGPAAERDITPAYEAPVSRTAALKHELRQSEAPAQDEPSPQDEAPPYMGLSYADVCAQINSSDSPETLKAAAASIEAFLAHPDNEKFRAELKDAYASHRDRLKAAAAQE